MDKFNSIVVPGLIVWSGLFMVLCGILVDKLHDANKKIRRAKAFIRQY